MSVSEILWADSDAFLTCQLSCLWFIDVISYLRKCYICFRSVMISLVWLFCLMFIYLILCAMF